LLYGAWDPTTDLVHGYSDVTMEIDRIGNMIAVEVKLKILSICQMTALIEMSILTLSPGCTYIILRSSIAECRKFVIAV
jgi:hypothetical protein